MTAPRFILPGLLCACVLALSAPAFSAPATTVYSTTFDTDENYNDANELIGQNGWIGEGTGGNGLLNDRFPNEGQQAYVGFYEPLNDGELSLSAWHPINYAPLTENKPIVTFTTTMEIVDSTNGKRDDFRWSVYNSSAQRLFTLSFNNHTAEICYVLDDGMGFQPTPYSFLRDTIYDLEIVMNFQNNVWSAKLDSTLLLENQPITTAGSTLDLGDVDAVWYYIDPEATGDNFMAFDNYTITAGVAPTPAPTVRIVERQQDGSALVRLSGEPDATYIIEVSDELSNWVELKTGTSNDGVIEHLDTGAANAPKRFYRGRLAEQPAQSSQQPH